MNRWWDQSLDMELWLVLNAMKSLNEDKLLRICRTLRKNFRSFSFSHHWQLPGSVEEKFFDIGWLLIIHYTIVNILYCTILYYYSNCFVYNVLFTFCKMNVHFPCDQKIIHAHSLQRKLQPLPPHPSMPP